MADTNGKIKYLGMEGVEALLEGLKGEYSPLEHEHDVVIKAESAENATNAEHSSTADEATHAESADSATNAEHANEADHATTADEATKAIQDGNGNVIVDTYALKSEAVLTTEQELTDEQKAIARNNIKSFGYNWHFLYSNCYCANIPENESITDWDNALSVFDSNNIPQLHNLVSHVSNLLRGDDNRIAKYNVVPNFISSVTALVDAGVFTLPMKLCGTFMTNNIDDPTFYLYFNISYTESKNRWIITNLSTSKMVIIVDGVVTTDQTLTYPDKSLSISDRTADAKAVGDALALKADTATVESTYETKIDASAKLAEAKLYIDTKVADLVNSAPETLDTLGELATAFEENQDVVEALDAAISNKQDKYVVATITTEIDMDTFASIYHCDKTFSELWTAHENGINVKVSYYNTWTADAKFEIVTTSTGEEKRIIVEYLSDNVLKRYTIKEDDSVSLVNKRFITENVLSQNTGENSALVMSQKAVTDALETKQDKNMIVTITSTTAEDGSKTYSADKTFAEIEEAYNNGTYVYAFAYDIALNYAEFHCAKVMVGKAWFEYYDSFQMRRITIIISDTNNVTVKINYKVASKSLYGGVKADAATETDTVPAKIGTDGKLYVPTYPEIQEQVQADWAQNDDTTSDYIKNRTHYTETSINSVTRKFNTNLTDVEFAQLLIENRQTTRYVIDDIPFVFNSDVMEDLSSTNWTVISEDGATTCPISVSYASPESTAKDTVFTISGKEVSITIDITKETYHQLDEKYIPDTIARVSDIPGHVQSDWEQNDSNGDGYIKNRPFYEEPVETVIVEETTVTLEEGVGFLTSIRPLEVGTEYTVILDGNAYTCIAKFDESAGMPYIGNLLAFGGEDTGEPFFIAPMNSDTELGIMVNSDIAKHTVSVVSMISEIHKIDEKFLPDNINDWNTLKNRPFYEKSVKEGILPEQTVIFSDGVTTFNNISIIDGENYVITIDGIEYFGDGVFESPDYYISARSKDNNYIIVYENSIYARDHVSDGDHTLSIDIVYTDTIKLDSKFLPDSVVRNDVSQSLTDEQKRIAINNIGAASLKSITHNSVWSGTASYGLGTIEVTLDNKDGFKLIEGVKISVRNIPILIGPWSALNLSIPGVSSSVVINDINGDVLTSNNYLPWENDGEDKIVDFCYIGGKWVAQCFTVAKPTRYGLVKLSRSVSDNNSSVPSSYDVKKYVDDAIAGLDIIPTNEQALELAAEMGLIEPAMNNGYILTDENGVIYTI